jgi:LPPG:FO 2-phospho-L-lactate transferase
VPVQPFLSIDPILAVPGLRSALQACAAPVIAVSPLVSGQAVKGPTAKMMQELGMTVCNSAIAYHYGSLIDALVVDRCESGVIPGIETLMAPTLMHSLQDREQLAQVVLALADRLGGTTRTARRA